MPEDDFWRVKLAEDVDDQFDRKMLDAACWEEADTSACIDYLQYPLVGIGFAHEEVVGIEAA